MQIYFIGSFLVGYFVTYFSKDSFWALLFLLIIAIICGSFIAPVVGILIFILMFIGFFIRKMIRHIKENIYLSFKELLNKLKKIFYSSPFYFYGNSNIMEFRN